MPEDGHPELTMARYQPEKYVTGDKTPAADLPIVGLLRSGLLKRFESSSPRLRPDHGQDGQGA